RARDCFVGALLAMTKKRMSLRGQRSNLAPSAQHPDLLSLNEFEIDMGAEAGLGRGVDEAVAIDGDVFGKTIFLHCVRQQLLEKFGVRERNDHMQVGVVVQ